MGRTQSTYLLQNYPGSSQPDYYPPHREHHHQGYHPSGGRGFEEHGDWSNGVPDQQGDYPVDLGYYPRLAVVRTQPSMASPHMVVIILSSSIISSTLQEAVISTNSVLNNSAFTDRIPTHNLQS